MKILTLMMKLVMILNMLLNNSLMAEKDYVLTGET